VTVTNELAACQEQLSLATCHQSVDPLLRLRSGETQFNESRSGQACQSRLPKPCWKGLGRYPAKCYLLIDHKLQILIAAKLFYGEHVTLSRVGDLLDCDLPQLLMTPRNPVSNLEARQ
jgi:hypothetical protein